MIGSSSLRIGTFHKHLVASAGRKQKTKRVIVAGLMLTSMVDMFSLLVIFLLQSFSNSPQVMTMNKGVSLPIAISGSMTKDAPVLSISSDEVTLDNKLVGSTINVIKSPQTLLAELQSLKLTWTKSHPKETFAGEIHLQADRALAAPLVSELMSILVSQGYSSIQLAVVSGGAK